MRHSRMMLFAVGFTLLAVGLAIPGIAEAQGSGRGFQIGIKGGWNSTTIRGDATTDFGTPINFETGNGFSAGGVFVVPFHANMAFQAEALFARKRVGANTTLLGIPATGEIESDYVDLPLLLKMHLGRDRGVVPFLLIGPTFSFLTRAEQTLELAGVIGGEDIKDDLTTVDVGATLALGIDFKQGWGAVTLEARYTLGLRTLDRDGDSDIKQGNLYALVGVIF